MCNFNRFKDKIHAILAIIRGKEYVVFTCQNFKSVNGSECVFSEGLNNFDESIIFREAISNFIIDETVS